MAPSLADKRDKTIEATQSRTNPSQHPNTPNAVQDIIDIIADRGAKSSRVGKSKEKRHIVKSVSTLVPPIQIEFTAEDLRRDKSDALPDAVYRTFYEGSATLSAFVTKDCLVKHREVPHLKLGTTHAFQNVGNFILSRDLTPERIHRHFKTGQKKEPSPFVSAWAHIDKAIKTAESRYKTARVVGHRISIAEIDTAGLVAATITARIQYARRTVADGDLHTTGLSVQGKPVKIPIYVRPELVPHDRSSIDIQDFYDSKSDMWVSIDALRNSDLSIAASTNHSHEWLACGPIPKTVVTKVMPYDGNRLHQEKGSKYVQSVASMHRFVFNWKEQTWLSNPDTKKDRASYRKARTGDKRGHNEAEDDQAPPAVQKNLHAEVEADFSEEIPAGNEQELQGDEE